MHRISILFSSHNGASTLPRMLERLAAVTAPSGGYEVVAVDNASTDATRQVLDGFTSRLPLKVLTCPEPGKNRALNLALKVASASLLVFTDDDVLPCTDWLTALQRAADLQPSYDIFGGAITPHWPSPPPLWLLEHVPLGMTYGVTDPTTPSGSTRPGLIWGANMMVRRRVFQAGHRFDESIGPGPGQYVMGSETEFNTRCHRAGFKCYFVSSATVEHIVRPVQLQEPWILGRAYRFGRSMWNEESAVARPGSKRIVGIPRWRLRSYLEHQMARLSALIHRDHASWFKHTWEIQRLHGYFAQWWLRR